MFIHTCTGSTCGNDKFKILESNGKPYLQCTNCFTLYEIKYNRDSDGLFLVKYTPRSSVIRWRS